MNYGEFMAFHRKNPAGRLYLLAGEEGYYIEKAKKRLLEMLFPDGVNIEDIMEFYKLDEVKLEMQQKEEPSDESIQ